MPPYVPKKNRGTTAEAAPRLLSVTWGKMMKTRMISAFCGGLLLLPVLVGCSKAASQNSKSDSLTAAASRADGNNKNGIFDRLERIEQAIADNTALIREDIARAEASINGPQTTATFCISQGRGLELAAAYAAGLEIEVELGPGWAAVVHAEAKGEVDFPFVVPVGPIPIPIPTEAKVEVKGGLGRGLDICVDIPVTLTAEDQFRLAELTAKMNDRAGTERADQGKFQRRAHRLLNYTAVRVLAQQDFFQSQSGAVASKSEQELEDEFDRADAAGDSLLDGGFGTMSDGLGVFGDGNVRDLLSSLEIPLEVGNFMNDPERLFNGLPDLRGDDGPILCSEVGISVELRNRRPRLAGLCDRLDSLPDFHRLRNARQFLEELSDELVDAIAAVVSPLLGNISETAEQTRNRFCATAIGQRRAFNRYCGR